jgi:hypothetical protein
MGVLYFSCKSPDLSVEALEIVKILAAGEVTVETSRDPLGGARIEDIKAVNLQDGTKKPEILDYLAECGYAMEECIARDGWESIEFYRNAYEKMVFVMIGPRQAVEVQIWSSP